MMTLEFPPFKGGVGVYAHHLASALAQEHEVTVLTSTESKEVDATTLYTVIRTPLLSRLIRPRWLLAYVRMRALLRAGRYDHIITPHILPLGVVAALSGVPYTISLHGMDILMAQRSAFKRMITRFVVKKARFILVNSAYTRECIMDAALYADKTIVVHPCPQELPHTSTAMHDELRQRYNIGDAPLALSVNRLVARKGNDTVIEAIARMDRTDIRYCIIGNGGYASQLQKLLTHYNLEDRVHIIHNVSNDELATWYAIADIFIMPARHEGPYDVEGFGIVYLEAGLHGLPVIAGNTGGVPEAVLDGITGILVDPTNTQAVTDALLYLLDHPSERERLGTAGQHRAHKNFTWSVQCKPYLQALRTPHEKI